MRILFVVSRPLEVNSSASLRNINTIKGLLLLGHCVTVVTAEPSLNHPQYNKVSFENTENVNFVYLETSVTKKLSASIGRNRLLNRIRVAAYKLSSRESIYDSWKCCINSIALASLDLNDYDVMISSSDPKSSHLIAEAIKGDSNIKWIQIWGDPFTDDITSTGRLEGKKSEEERRFILKADKVAYLSPLTAEHMKNKYKDCSSKICFMPRPYIKASCSPINDGLDSRMLNISFCGDYHSSVRNIIPLFSAVKQSDSIKLTLVGNTDLKLESSENITILPRQTSDVVEKIESNSDILIHISNISGTQIPGKIYNYASTNKPILFVLDGDSDDVKTHFSQYNRFVFCNNTADDIISGLKEIKNDNSHVNNNPIEAFRYDNVLTRLLDIN